jgi:uncharacterized OB-fold protein
VTPIEFAPKPAPTEQTEPFWRAGLDGHLALQHCDACGHIRYPVSTICPVCLSPTATWKPLAGLGTVSTYVVFERAYDPSWADEVPYVVALVELDEGPTMLTNVVQIDPAAVRVGQRVEVTFIRRSADAVLPQFRPTDRDAS